ncbi:DUF4340 domain-containing protein [Candidatus Poribacteria bacterium]|nr:DUF4340 domain-containing protein [Candidatus Poribacteria bacterium]
MKNKKILILLSIFIVLLVITIILERPFGDKESDEETLIFPDFDADQVVSVEIKTKDKEVKLNKEGDTWIVATADNYAADAKAVSDMLAKVKELEISLVASKSADKHAQFEVDEENGTQIKLFGPEDKLLAHLFVGKMGSDFMSTYVRKANQDRVLLVDGYLKSSFDKGTRGWRNRTIFDFDESQAQRLTLVPEDKDEIAIEAQEDGSWQILKPEVAPGNKEEIDRIVRDIAKLSADDFPKKEEETEETPIDLLEKYNLNPPKSKIMVDLKDGTARVLLIGDESNAKNYVKREEKDTVFMVYKSKINKIFLDIESLKAKVEEEPAGEDDNNNP